MVRKMDNRSRGSPVLRLERISMRSGRLQVLTDIDPSREQAAIVGLIAPNGAGKSTLSNGITSLYKPDEGDFFCGVGSFRFGLQAADCRAMVEGEERIPVYPPVPSVWKLKSSPTRRQ
jgi:ABC-type sugar transport system ATPase subunit